LEKGFNAGRYTMKPTYDRNDFLSILEQAKCCGLNLTSMKLLTIGEREPDPKIIEAGKCGFDITVLEVFQPNILKIQTVMPNWRFIHLDISELPYRPDIDLSGYDIIWWYHGPEHLSKAIGKNVIAYLKHSSRFIISSMPHGMYDQSELYGNLHERHVSAWYPDDFKEVNGTVYTENETGDDKTSLDIFIKGEFDH
jgi:hypothetical protein